MSNRHPSIGQAIERGLNRFVRANIQIAGRPVSSFQVCGVTGFSLAVVVAMLLVWRLNLSVWVILALAVAGALTFFALAMATKILTGQEQLIYYHHEIAVVAVAAIVLRVLRQPAAAYLDLTVLGVGLMLMCGRIGCLMVGCCHGHPWHWGVRYRAEHASAGFLACYLGVPLFPVQLIEAISLAAILSVNVFLILTRAPGVAFAWYIAAYAILRFALEFLRGDPGRPTVAGFSEAQWTSLALSLGAGILYPGCRVVAGLLAAWMLIVTIARGMRKAPRHRLLHPSHVQEMAEALQRTRGLHVESTSMGIRISAGEIRQGGSRVFHYAFSSSGAPLSGHAAEVLAALVVNLRHSAEGPTRLTAGNSDVFHLLVHPMRPEG